MTTTNFDNHDIQQHILTILNSAAPIADTQLLSYPGRQASDPEECAFTEYQLSIKSALDSLVKKEIFLEHHLLTQEGHHLAQSGSHEYWVWDALGKDGLLMAKLQAKPGPDSAKIGQGKAFRNKRIKKRSDGGFIQAVCVPFRLLSDIIILSIHLFFQVTADQLITQTKLFIFLTLMEVKLIVFFFFFQFDSGRWKTATFKPYNLNTEGVPPNGGALHPLINVRDPLIKVREEFSNIFFGMGFIPGTGDGKYIKTSLWYFDSLFVPQQHPVQGSQDMSYLQDSVSSTDFPSEY
ncbi:hypothetical protein PSTG_10688 [Puccinia striiformis f. sp. tritici PST-78]|uniref:Phenylalanyl-tRNA synthetase domain-containing protein n=1 Tax=Puccinia striiformis f. sp. tritici PST-78 TaxID=1165861 RepID=A0A0L0V9P1_9BASI|nr:hypothetical protein PSTG_10688 [Puccinia striiformis f. sp. tritici PST-78]